MVNSRQKGKRGELQARNAARVHWFAKDCIRAAQACGAWAADLLYALPGFHVEVKSYKKVAALNWYRQAQSDRNEDELPIVLMTENGDSNWYIILDIKHTQEFINAVQQNKASQRTEETDL